LSEPDLLGALIPVAEALEGLGVRYHVGGSVASSAYGIARASVDVDVVAELRPEHALPLVERLRSDYYVDQGRVGDAILRRRSFNLIHLATMLKIDVFVSKDRPFDRQALERSLPQALEAAEPARRFPFASPEDVVLAKLEWFRSGGETSERQWNDVLGVLRVSAPSLDRSYMRRWAVSLGTADLLERALGEVET